MRTPRQRFRTAPWVLAVVVAFGVALVAQPAAAQAPPKPDDKAAKPATPPPAKPNQPAKKAPEAPKKAQKGSASPSKAKLTPAQAAQKSKLHAAARGKGVPEPTVVLKPGEVPKIKFDSVTWDFGRVPAGTPVEHEYWFTNTGNGPLEILRVKPG